MRFIAPTIVLGSLLLSVACGASSEKESPIAAGSYVLTNDEETVMVIDDQGYFSWMVRSCSDWMRDDKGSLEREPDGSIRIIACGTYPGGGAAFWAPDVPATKLRARLTEDGFAVDVETKGGPSITQQWKRGNTCRSGCNCGMPHHAPGC